MVYLLLQRHPLMSGTEKIMDLLFCSINVFLSAEFQTFPSSVEMNYREGLS